MTDDRERRTSSITEPPAPGSFWVHAEGGHYMVERNLVLMPGRRDAVQYRDTDHINDPQYVRELTNFRERFRPCEGHTDMHLTKDERHVRHYRSCNCLGDSADCCNPQCCPSPSATDQPLSD